MERPAESLFTKAHLYCLLTVVLSNMSSPHHFTPLASHIRSLPDTSEHAWSIYYPHSHNRPEYRPLLWELPTSQQICPGHC